MQQQFLDSFCNIIRGDLDRNIILQAGPKPSERHEFPRSSEDHGSRRAAAPRPGVSAHPRVEVGSVLCCEDHNIGAADAGCCQLVAQLTCEAVAIYRVYYTKYCGGPPASRICFARSKAGSLSENPFIALVSRIVFSSDSPT
jgi:hypothetical protein